jgi:hypothetical protein
LAVEGGRTEGPAFRRLRPGLAARCADRSILATILVMHPRDCLRRYLLFAVLDSALVAAWLASGKPLHREQVRGKYEACHRHHGWLGVVARVYL